MVFLLTISFTKLSRRLYEKLIIQLYALSQRLYYFMASVNLYTFSCDHPSFIHITEYIVPDSSLLKRQRVTTTSHEPAVADN